MAQIDILANANQILQANLTECQQEAQLLRSELTLCTAILNLVNEIVVVLGPQGYIVLCNCACEQTSGYTFNEVRNQPFWELLLTLEEKEPVKAAFEKIQVDKLAIAHEHDWITKEGSRCRIAWTYTPFLNGDGTFKYVIGTGNDITRRKQAEPALPRLHEELESQVAQRTAELEANNRLLSARDRLLEATASAANALLTVDSFDEAANTALQIIGEALDTDRVCVGEHHDDPAGKTLGYVRYLYEWDSPHVVRQIEQPGFVEISYDGLKQLYLLVSQGYMVDGVIDEMPEPFRSEQKKLGVQSSCAIPIMVGGKYWGVMGFDDCREAKHRSAAEFAVLKTAAACIGSAIQRDRLRRQREAAERAVLLEREKAAQERVAELAKVNEELRQRDRILEATAITVNALLTINNFEEAVTTVLQILGEVLDTDRVVVVENFHPSDSSTPHWRVLYECNSPDAVSQIAHCNLAQGTWEGIEEWYEQLIQGQGVSCLMEEMPEPFRSGQAELGVKAVHGVPIFVEGKLWGIVGFHDCREAKRRNLTELAVLQIAADCIGSGIQRERTQQALLKAEQARSQELERHNTELQQALERLSESEECYRTLFELSSEGILRFGYKQPIPITLPFDEQLDLCYQSIYIAEGNNAFAKMYEYKKAEDVIGLTLNALHDRDSEVTQATMQTWIENRYSCQSLETVEIDHQGRKRYFLNSSSSTIKNGFVVCTWVSQVDITQLRETQQALLEAASERAAELAKANNALKRSLDSLATELSLDKFLGQVLKAIAEQFDSPLVEYWYYLEDTAYIGMMSWQERIYNREAISVLYPTHPGVAGFKVPPERIHGEILQHRKKYYITEDWLTNPFTKHVKWYLENGLYKEINVPMVLGDKCIGALVVRMPRKHQITTQQIELAQALAHQVTLAVQLTQLAEESHQAAILDERNRMARDIHDTLAQAFTGIIIQLEATKRKIGAVQLEAAQTHITRARSLATAGLCEARRSVRALRPEALESHNLPNALRHLAEQMACDATIQISVRIEGTPYSLPVEVETNLLRVGQEALTNALRHAQAQTIRLELLFEAASVHLQIVDDGQGFDPQSQVTSAGFGLIGMQERSQHISGQFILTSRAGQGTAITVSVPISSLESPKAP